MSRRNDEPRPRRKLLTAVISQCLAAGIAGGAHAATINVTAGAVADADDGQCSITEAILNANGDDQSGSVDCTAGSGDDSIVLPASTVFTLTAAIATANGGDRGLPAMRSNITLEGNGSTITRSSVNATPEFGILSVENGATVTLRNTTLSNGSAGTGAGIISQDYVSGTRLTLEDSTITGNTAMRGGGLLTDRETRLRIDGGAVTNNVALSTYSGGGGLATYGYVVLSETTIAGNSASYGGGAMVPNDYMRSYDSIFRNNQAAERGGAIYVRGYDTRVRIRNSTIDANVAKVGGGISVYNGLMTNISDSTLSNNRATELGGGIHIGYSGDATVQLEDSLLYRNSAAMGGGIANQRFLTVFNSTLSGNSANQGGGIFHQPRLAPYSGATDGAVSIVQATIVDNVASDTGDGLWVDTSYGGAALRNSIIANDNGNSDCVVAAGAFSANVASLIADGTCSPALDGDPRLGPLLFNGGRTRTHELLAGSPAIDSGAEIPCPFSDQRGASRDPQTCDIGAFELTAPIIVDANASVGVVEPADDGQCSLIEAINNTNNNSQQFNSDGECERGQFGAADRIQLPAGSTFTLTAPDGTNSANGLPVVTGEAVIEGNGATIERDSASAFRLLENQSNLRLEEVTLGGGAASSPDDNGGAIANSGTLTLMQSTLSDNYAARFGGAMTNDANGVVAIRDTTVVGNSGGLDVGGIDNYGTLDLVNSTVSGNSTTGGGGGIFNNGGATLNSVNSTFAFNAAGLGGRGIVGNGTVNLTNTLIADGDTSGVPDCVINGSLVVNSKNLIEDGSCSAEFMGTGGTLIAPLADNGGPTLTHDLVFSGNPAIDQGDDAACAQFDFDQRGAPFDRQVDSTAAGTAQCDIGAIEFSDELAPAAAIAAADVNTAGATFYEFTITYTDDSSIDASTIDLDDIQVVGPLGTLVEISSAVSVISDAEMVATYRVAPPGGSWDQGDNGSYSVQLNANQVFDLAGNPVPAASDAFNVSVPISDLIFADGFDP